MPETFRGQIERVTFHNPDNGFAVLKVLRRNEPEPTTVVGTVAAVTQGELLEAVGEWIVDPNHGRQFKAQSLKTKPPTTAEGIERFLGSGVIKGIGPSLAARIVKLYKERSLDILETAPEMLLHIRGIGRQKLVTIRESWQQQRGVRELTLFLQPFGIGPGRAVRIWRTYGERAIGVIKENPYQLAEEVRGIGFKTADELAQRMGLDPKSPYRARAAVQFVLHELAGDGHTGFPADRVATQTCELTEIDRSIVDAAIENEIREKKIIREGSQEPWLFLASLYRAERGVAFAIRKLLQDEAHPLPKIDVEVALDWVQKKLSLELAEAQKEAVREACRQKFVVVTGGPGVGKTTLVRSILEIFSAKKKRCVLAAPTGRAAKRLAESTGREAKTVHRLLEFDGTLGDFARNEHRPLAGDLFVLDEVSMVDVVLAHQYLRAIPPSACVVWVGDPDQLPSVGPGTVLGDLIASRVVPVVRLTEIFRQAQTSRIIQAAAAVNRGEVPDLESGSTLTDFYFVEADEPEAIRDRLVRMVKERIPERFGFDRDEIQVLAPMNRSILGTRQLNEVLQGVLNPKRAGNDARSGDGDEVQRFDWTYRVGDRVMQTENNYDREVFNGDLGRVLRIDTDEQKVMVSFDGRPVPYEFNDLDELAPAFAITIHKSQGSEYPCVVVPLHTLHFPMLERNLIYTAMTRGKRLVVVVGSRKAFEMAIRRHGTRERCTKLRERLAEIGR